MEQHTFARTALAKERILGKIIGYLMRSLGTFYCPFSTTFDFDKHSIATHTGIQYALVSHQWMNTIYITSDSPALKFMVKSKFLTKTLRPKESYKRWRSNINSVIRMSGLNYTTRLYINTQNSGPLPPLDMLLDGFGFGAATWLNLRDIVFCDYVAFQPVLWASNHVDRAYSYLHKLAPSLGNIHSRPNYVLDLLDKRFTNRKWYLDVAPARHLSTAYFPHLTSLYINDTSSLASLPIFPKLQSLQATNIFNGRVDFNELFIDARLQSLRVTERPEFTPSIHSVPLKHVDTLYFDTLPSSTPQSIAILKSSVTQLFEVSSDVRHADVQITMLPITALNWPNLINLKLRIISIDWNIVESLLEGLPCLRTLTIIRDQGNRQLTAALSLGHEIESYNPTSTREISKSLEGFEYYNLAGTKDAGISEFVLQLVSRTPSLMVIKSRDIYDEGLIAVIASQNIEFRS
ncbi:hypothetical protein DL89DRAFT_264020 [Linderina pennispora]|uniref:F-box domain-containing protein n=1 Tax=Linderina pennispora TaxID=61395 RepID=A0A1Y1WKF2_9FUNG|nr:uncharacterized protein DL89DRAFT_264020 [Linderina pennispora]ORX74029.1 hypothetical protein DL89DRAFT_264020 [Linderina pennispora]